MNRYRIGNDLYLQVAVTRIGGEPEDFTGILTMEVLLWHMYKSSERHRMEAIIEGNIVRLQFAASLQSVTGQYGLTVRYAKPDEASESGTRTYVVDVPFAFELTTGADDGCCCGSHETCSPTEPLELCAEVMIARDGINGVTPHIGENGHWYVGNTDTGITAKGQDGQPGATPRIGDNGNWWIGDTDTGQPSRGADGRDGIDGADGADGKDGKDGKDGNALWPSLFVDGSGELVMEVPDSAGDNNLAMDEEGYLCLQLSDLI